MYSNVHFVHYHRLLTITTIIRWSIHIVKKVVMALPAEGKKWGLHYQEHNIGGKMWEKMFISVVSKWGERDYPIPQVCMTF